MAIYIVKLIHCVSNILFQGGKIQATVKKELIPVFEQYIKEDVVLLIQRFGVGEQKDNFPIIKRKIKMNFYRCTQVFAEQTFTGHPYGFSFVPFTEVFKDKGKVLPNVG